MSSGVNPNIHPSAVIDAAAVVPASCKIGPFCYIGPEVELGENCHLHSHVVIGGPTKIGSNNRIFPFAAIGGDPQDLKFSGEKTRLEIGDNNTIREYVTISRGTPGGGGVTTIGNNCLIMAYVHIAHDCHIGDRVIMANAATLAGHVTVEHDSVVGALCPVHQFVRIGAYSFIGGGTTITQDVLPFTKTSARRENRAFGANTVGLERKGFAPERLQKLQKAFRILLASKLNTSQALEKIKAQPDLTEEVQQLVRFIESSERGIIK
jgi:UDP-N-acetylglucosamine acyltransferase